MPAPVNSFKIRLKEGEHKSGSGSVWAIHLLQNCAAASHLTGS